MEQPNPIQVLFSVIRALITTATPQPAGRETVSHDQFAPVLKALEQGGLPAAADWEEEVDAYLDELSAVDPSNLTRDEALAFWLNLYNAGGVQLAIEAHGTNKTSVLGIPGATQRAQPQRTSRHI